MTVLSNFLYVVFGLSALQCTALDTTDFCLTGSDSNSLLNGNYAKQSEVDSNGNAYYKRCDEYLYQYRLGSNYYWQFSRSAGSSTYNIKCPTPNIESPNLCASGKWKSGSSTESSIIVSDNACVVPQISCTNILLRNTGSMNCDGLFTKVDDNLYSRQSSSNCGGFTGTQYWYYNERWERYECSNEDKRDPCQTGVNYFTTYSTDSTFGNITERQTDVSVNVNGASATLSCGVEPENQVIECENIDVTGSNYCNGLFIKKNDNVYENTDTGRFWFLYTYNELSTAFGKMMCSASDQSSVCSPTYMSGDIAQNSGLPNFQSGTGGASVALSSGTATFVCNAPTSAGKKSKDKKDENLEAVIAIASFESSDSGVDGTVKVDEIGNVFINLDVSKLNTTACGFDGNDGIVLEYGIYNRYAVGELKSRNGNGCISEIVGDVYNPFNVAACSEYNSNGDMYFECAIGDLSGRFGDAIANSEDKVVIEGNISEEGSDKESGFCLSRLTPQSLYQKSVVFVCKDDKSTNLFCAPFQIEKSEETQDCKQLGESCETREDCCDSECVDLSGDGKKKCYLE